MNSPHTPIPQHAAVTFITLEAALAHARDSGVRSLEAQVLLAHVVNKSRGWLLAHPEAPIGGNVLATYAGLLQRSLAGEPLAYLIGEREFYKLPFHVSPDVLIPRPETEHLVEAAIAWAKPRQPLSVADVGTGSGAIVVSLATHLPQARIVATDTSQAALSVARRNAMRHKVPNRVQFVQSDLLAGLRGPFDLIASNPPYIQSAELAALDVARHEPHLALDGGPDGLRVVRRLMAQARQLLARPGLLLVEIGAGQGPAVLNVVRALWDVASVTLLPDYAGHERVLRVELPSP